MHVGLRIPGWAASLALATTLILAACQDEPAARSPLAAESERVRTLGAFLISHWSLPVALQGEPPAAFSEAEASLEPAVCGACHPKQHAEWRTSLHAGAYSPGFAGQLIEGVLATPAEVRACQTCHAPLGEQQPNTATGEREPAFEPALRAQGIVCASCHVRKHRYFGPPRRAGLAPLPEPAPHGGFEVREEYVESRFCASCHQFFDDPGVNGKPIENTFVEWQQSPQAAAGRQCQSCHMPDRAHLWRGIHDPNMVRSAVDVDLISQDLSGDTLEAALVLLNRDVGHAFPSYVTPRVRLELVQVDAAGRELDDTRLEASIGRQVDFETNTELFDTRVLPGESVKLEYGLARAAAAVALVGRVTVDPDFHYRGVFDVLLTTLEDVDARAQISEARRRIATSAYVLAEIRRTIASVP